jgi:hypothetical protein
MVAMGYIATLFDKMVVIWALIETPKISIRLEK